MRLMKMFGLAAIAAVAATAFLGASSASALSTQLCKVNTELACPEGQAVTSVHMVNTGVGTLLNDLVDVLCLDVLANATPLALGAPQVIHTLELEYNECGTSADHDECDIEVEELPLFHVLKTGNDVGSLLALNGLTRVKCTVFGFIKINCLYDTTGILFEVKGPSASDTTNGDLKAEGTPVEFVEGSGLCPEEENTLDGLLLPLEPTYVKSLAYDTQLCKSNKELKCPEGQAVTSVHMVNTGVGTLLNDLVDVLCLDVLANATPLALGAPQVVHTLELEYNECGTSADHDECDIEVEELPLFHVLKTGNDVGSLLALNGLTRVKCTVFGFIKINCLYDTTGILFEVKGPSASGTTNGDLKAEGTPVEFVEGSGLCPEEENTLDGLLLPLEPTYVKS